MPQGLTESEELELLRLQKQKALAGQNQQQAPVVPEKLFGVNMPTQGQFESMLEAARQRDQGYEDELTRRGEKIIAARQRDPDYIGWTPNQPPAAYAADRLGRADGAHLGFGDEIIGLFNREKGQEIGALKEYAGRAYPDQYEGGRARGNVFNALITAPVGAPKALNLARFMPKGTQAATASATSAVAWDTLDQLGTGQGGAVERLQNIDTDRTKTAAIAGGTLGGVLSAFTRSLSNGASEFGTLLEGVVDNTGAISDDGVRALEYFLRDNRIPLNDVTLGRLNSVIQDARQSAPKALALPVRIKDVLVNAFEDGSGKFTKAVETQLRGTMVHSGDGAAVIAKSIDDDLEATYPALEEQYGFILGKKSRKKTRDAAEAEMRRIGTEGYEPLLKKGPMSQAGADELNLVIKGPGVNKLYEPLRTIAAGEGISLDQMIDETPLRAAHWMQSKARELSQTSSDAAIRSSMGRFRSRLLKAINNASPGYDEIRKKYGDEFGNKQALDFGKRFLTDAGKALEIDDMKEAWSGLTVRQKNAALLSVRDMLKAQTGRGRRGQAPRLTKVGERQVLDALEDVFGIRGKRIGDAIEEIDQFIKSRQNVDVRLRSPTAPNEAAAAAVKGVENPIRRKIGAAFRDMAGDAVLTAGGFGPLNMARRGLYGLGNSISGDVMGRVNALAEVMEAPVKRTNALTPRSTPSPRSGPARGPDGRFISAKKQENTALPSPDDRVTERLPIEAYDDVKQSGIGGSGIDTVSGAAYGAGAGALAPAEDNEQRLKHMAAGAVLGATAGNLNNRLTSPSARRVLDGSSAGGFTPAGSTSNTIYSKSGRKYSMAEGSTMSKVIELARQGKSNAQIDEALGLSPGVAAHYRNVAKTGKPPIDMSPQGRAAPMGISKQTQQDYYGQPFEKIFDPETKGFSTLTDSATDGRLKVVERPDGWSSIFETYVPSESRRQGAGTRLLERALSDYPNLQGSFTSEQSIKNAFRLGMRDANNPGGSLEDALRVFDSEGQVLLRSNGANMQGSKGSLPMDEASRMARDMNEVHPSVPMPSHRRSAPREVTNMLGDGPIQYEARSATRGYKTPARLPGDVDISGEAASARYQFNGERFRPYDLSHSRQVIENVMRRHPNLNREVLQEELFYYGEHLSEGFSPADLRINAPDSGNSQEWRALSQYLGENLKMRNPPSASDSPVLTAGIGGRRDEQRIARQMVKAVQKQKHAKAAQEHMRRVGQNIQDQAPPPRQPQNALAPQRLDRGVGDGGEGLALLLGGAAAVGGGGMLMNQMGNRNTQAQSAPGGANAFAQSILSNTQSGLNRRKEGLPFPPSVKPDLSRNMDQMNQAAYLQSKDEMQSLYESLPQGQRLAWNQLRKEMAEELKVKPEEARAGIIAKRLLPNGELQVLTEGQWKTLEFVQ